MSSVPEDVPKTVGHKVLDRAVEDLADYLSVNCPDDYEAITSYGRSRFKQGVIYGSKEASDRIIGIIKSVVGEPTVVKSEREWNELPQHRRGVIAGENNIKERIARELFGLLDGEAIERIGSDE